MGGKRACDRCSAIKQSCSGNSPCERCVRLDELCTFDRPLKPVGRPSSRSLDRIRSSNLVSINPALREAHSAAMKRTGSVASKGSKNITRSRTGCISCRIRKKKCDEAWPQCGDCQRLNKKCSGPVDSTSKRALERARSMTPFTAALQQDDIVSGATPTTTADIDVVVDPEVLAAAASDQHPPPVDENNVSADMPAEEEIEEIPNTAEKSVVVNNNAMLLDCEMEIVKNTCDFWQLPLSIRSPLIADSQLDSTEKELLTYFKDVVIPILFMQQKGLGDVSEAVIPMCLQHNHVKYPILGIAAAHRAGRDPGYFLDYMCYKEKAQKTVELALNSQSEESMLSLLMMVYLEVLDGVSTNWSYYLENVFQRMNSSTTDCSSKIFPFIKQTFYYLDSVSSLSTCNPPFASRDKKNQQHAPGNSSVRFGLCGELGSILGDISTLSSMRALRSQHFILEDQFNSFAEFIEVRLNKFPLPSDVSVRPEGICESEHMNFILTWKWAALMRLHQIQQGYDKDHPRVRECLKNIICSLKSIEDCLPLECGLIFPLIMAGSAATCSKDQEYIVQRVRSLKAQLGFGYVDQVEKLLQTIWEREQVTHKPVNWASVRYYEFSGIVMI